MMYCLIFIGIGLVSLVAMFLQVRKTGERCDDVLSYLYWYRIGQLGSYFLTGKKKQERDVIMYCLIFNGIGLVSLVAMFLEVRKSGARCDDELSNLYWYRIGQLGRYVLTGKKNRREM